MSASWLVLPMVIGCTDPLRFDVLPGVTPPTPMRTEDWEGYWVVSHGESPFPSEMAWIGMGLVFSITVVSPDAWLLRTEGGVTLEYPEAFSAEEPDSGSVVEIRLADGRYLIFDTAKASDGTPDPTAGRPLSSVMTGLPRSGRFGVVYIDKIVDQTLRTLPGRPSGDDWVLGELTPTQLQALLKPNPNPYVTWGEQTVLVTRLPR